MPVPSEKPHARSIAAHQHAKPVMLDFMQPARPSRRLRGWTRQAGLTEVGEDNATQQHGGKLTAFFTRCDSKRNALSPNLLFPQVMSGTGENPAGHPTGRAAKLPSGLVRHRRREHRSLGSMLVRRKKSPRSAARLLLLVG